MYIMWTGIHLNCQITFNTKDVCLKWQIGFSGGLWQQVSRLVMFKSWRLSQDKTPARQRHCRLCSQIWPVNDLVNKSLTLIIIRERKSSEADSCGAAGVTTTRQVPPAGDATNYQLTRFPENSIVLSPVFVTSCWKPMLCWRFHMSKEGQKTTKKQGGLRKRSQRLAGESGRLVSRERDQWPLWYTDETELVLF